MSRPISDVTALAILARAREECRYSLSGRLANEFRLGDGAPG
ncbi:hypothetical protein X737_29950 [Mesorhizobium sp. L48C026A00]|nr:hypothetical protein X737_29950 [Mesorhizobium sp. L48C026A00]